MDDVETVDWDLEVGLWLKNIPYIWHSDIIAGGGDIQQNSIWRGCKRTYIFPLSARSALQPITGKSNAYMIPRGFGPGCGWDVINYFICITTDVLKWDENYKVRVNGYPVYIPSVYKKGGKNMDIANLYDFIGVKIPHESDLSGWKTALLVSLEEPQPPSPFIDVDLPIQKTKRTPNTPGKMAKK